ncbi:porin family protein [Xinfangfangia sp. CPCC 101601]|uniref:Porin family protein n=1 Tax=Pseudogemmobacter lacusdianii TaxID=3069608 RepID=A0ABU0W2H0_9RHOB|nr:porin family protein [Xinfangfangia sp. CPCC 101601]MDQ2068144.1 porin family protein [Xinfangfangia sp. CPCC 101601]
MKKLLLTAVAAAGMALTAPVLAEAPTRQAVDEMTGRAAELVKEGRVDDAAQIYDFLLTLAPNYPRFLMDMAHIQMLQGNWADAKAKLQQVRNMPGIPEHIASAIDGRLAYIETQTYRSKLSGQISFGLTAQSNVNAGPEDRQIDIFGLPFTLSSSAMPQSDIIARAAIDLDYRLRLGDGNTFFNAQMSFVGLNYNEFDDLNRKDLGVQLGFLLPLEGFPLAKSHFQIHAVANKTWIGGDSYQDSAGLLATYTATPTERLQIRLGASYQQDDYLTSLARPSADDRDGDKTAFSLMATYALSESLRLLAGVEAAKLDAEEDYNSWSGTAVRLGLSKKYTSPIAALPGAWTTAISVEHSQRDYVAPEVMFSTDPQATDITRFSLVQTVPLSAVTEARLSLSSAKATSTYDIYSWSDQSASLSFLYKF